MHVRSPFARPRPRRRARHLRDRRTGCARIQQVRTPFQVRVLFRSPHGAPLERARYAAAAMEDLFERARRAGKRALAAGALGPIETEQERLVDDGIPFVIRVVSSLARKEQAARSRPPTADPFGPWEEALFVGDAGDDHVLILNKFPVYEGHLLLVTRRFEPQESLLSTKDFEALAVCLAHTRALAFYNSGRIAGASQPHKHLQLVPEPWPGDTRAAPLESARQQGRSLPFPHASCATPSNPKDWPHAYADLLAEAGCSAAPAPYNLLMTHDWMMVVPRSREHYRGISINALGFAGSLLVRNHQELELLREAGPLRALTHVCRLGPSPRE